MTLGIATLTIDSKDASGLARWWGAALDYKITYETPPEEREEVVEVAIGPKDGKGLEILFLEVPDQKVVKNRYHFDLRPEDQEAEVKRLTDMGATKVDIGQGSEVSWVVLADPEGNEFCILRALTPEERAEQEAEEQASS